MEPLVRAWSRRRQLSSCLIVSIAAFGVFGMETSGLMGSMHVARSGHQATLLMDGRVLVTGGSDERDQAIGAAEIFNPATGSWSVAAANLTPRLGHAASLLHDGRVLVVGGVPFASSCEPIAAAELYDPSTDRWSIPAQIPVPVGRGTAAATLKDGRVLASGGGTACGDVYSSAALFDPSSNRWSRTVSMAAPEQFHVAVLLADGRVLVSGRTTTVYDPNTGVWTPVGDPRPLTDSACEGDVPRYSRELGRDSLIARATRDECPSVTVLPAGTLLVAGGLSTSDRAGTSVQLFDLRTGEDLRSWPMQVARTGHTATRLRNGAVLIAGGRDDAARIGSSELYIPRLAYEASLFRIPRAGSIPLVSYSYGSMLAAATNSRNHLLISYTGGSGDAMRLLEWDPQMWEGDRSRFPKYPPHLYIRALAPELPDLDSIRVDEQDNVWAVSSSAQEIFKISSGGQTLLRFGRSAPSDISTASDASPAQSSGEVETPSDVAWDRRGNVFVTDAGERPRIIKFDSRGRFLGAVGRKGSDPGSLDSPQSLATDTRGNVYVADSGNARIQVFDNRLNLRAVYDTIGTPWAICISKGSDQFLYSASNPDRSEAGRRVAEIYKLELDGTILGKAVGDEPSASIRTLLHIHCLEANTIVGLSSDPDGRAGYPYRITFAR
jgi:hypothetical protein